MPTGAITQYIDVAQLVLYAFWIFFAGLIYYLHRENKREGYPLESTRYPVVLTEGFPAVPDPIGYKLRDGTTAFAPHGRDKADKTIAAKPAANFPGAPLVPTGDPYVDNVGPGSWTARADVPDRTADDLARIVPLRLVPAWSVAHQDPDPRGKPVIGCDGRSGGTVKDLWVDRAEVLFRYLEVDVGKGRTVLLPINFARVRDGDVLVKSIRSDQFARVPATKLPDQVTLLEEEKIMAYYGAGTLYALPSRQEPLL